MTRTGEGFFGDLVGTGGTSDSLPSRAFVFGADTTRRRNLAAADCLPVEGGFSGDVLPLSPLDW